MSQAASTLSSTWLSDEAILGIEPDTSAGPPPQPASAGGEISRPGDGHGITANGGDDQNGDHASAGAGGNEDAGQARVPVLPRDADPDSRAAPRDTSVTIHALPAATLEQLDAAYYSPEPAARAQFAQTLFASDPAAFRAMFNEAARLLGVPVGQALLPVQPPPGSELAGASANSSGENSSLHVAPGFGPAAAGAPATAAAAANAEKPGQAGVPVLPGAFPAAQYRAFESATNDALSRDVRGAISSTLEQVLPEGTSAGAARRIADDIYTDIGKQLAADAQLSSQVGEVLRGWQFGPGEQQQVSTLLTVRARQLLPSAARKVIGEWSSNVLATARTRAARSEASASRVDVGNAASRPAASSEPARALKPREIDYGRTSDDDILAM
jgi:hypothetical protein